MVNIVDNEQWRMFLQQYRDLPELWNVQNPGYKDRIARDRGWNILMQSYRNINKNATMEQVKARINNIRACYRRVLRRVNSISKYGSSDDYVPTPSLWYFDFMDFIRDQETAQSRRKHRKKEEHQVVDRAEEEEIEIPLEFHEIDEPKPVLDEPTNKKHLIGAKRTREHLIKIPASFDSGLDEASIYANSWACSYRKLSPEQQLFAKKAIEEILILGQLNALTFSAVDLRTVNTEFNVVCGSNERDYDSEDEEC